MAFASLAAGSPELHAAWGELLGRRLEQAGFPAQLTLHGLGFELSLLVGAGQQQAKAATQALLRALTSSVGPLDTLTERQPPAGPAPPASAPAARSEADRCSAELALGTFAPSGAELELERVASFAADRSGLAIVGDPDVVAAVAEALEGGPDWPASGRVLGAWPARDVTEILPSRGSSASLAVALRVPDPNRALAAATRLAAPESALEPRLAALGGGLQVERITATAHPQGACLRVDARVDASPPPDVKRLGFAVQLIEEEANLALGEEGVEGQLEGHALSATDPRLAARRAAYLVLVGAAEGAAQRRIVSVTTPDRTLTSLGLDQAAGAARAEPAALAVAVRAEANQPGFWALVSIPCGASSERGDSAGQAALFFAAASLAAPRGVRLEPWVGPGGVGLLGYAERTTGEPSHATAARLGDALGRALVEPPSALAIADARTQLMKAVGVPRPALGALLDVLAPGHVGALMPRGTFAGIESGSRDAVLVRQRELSRLPHRLAVLSPGEALEGNLLGQRLARWLKSPEPARPSPCAAAVEPPARAELAVDTRSAAPEGTYVAFRIAAETGPDAELLAELLNQAGGALQRALAEPELVGAARALVFGGHHARALVIQVSAFEGQEANAFGRIQRLLDRLASGTVFSQQELDRVTARRREAHRTAALDPRFRLVSLLEGGAPSLPDAASLRALMLRLRSEHAIVVRAERHAASPERSKSPAAR